MADTTTPRTVVVSIDSYRPTARTAPASGQLHLFETAPPALEDRTRRPLTRDKIAHRQRMLTFLAKAR